MTVLLDTVSEKKIIIIGPKSTQGPIKDDFEVLATLAKKKRAVLLVLKGLTCLPHVRLPAFTSYSVSHSPREK
jgi:hypothetical protein